MTRFARTADGNRKRPLDPSTWKDLKKERKSKKNKEKAISKKSKMPDNAMSVNIEKEGTNKDHTESLESRLRGISQLSKSDKELEIAYKKEKRSENRRLQRIQKRNDDTVCYHCRGSGHIMSECPEAKRDVEMGTGICFKCGSTEHSSSKCSVRVPAGKYPYAKCFICGETGHLSKQCPDNPKGLYPMGGCCKVCESVEHYQRDCPELQSKQGIKSYCLPTMNRNMSVDAEIEIDDPPARPVQQKKSGPKTVIF